MGAPTSGTGGAITGINVTPMVDITLVLLIVFIVTAKLIEAPAVPLDLPRASHAEGTQIVFSVVIPVSGPTLVDGQPVASGEALRQRAAEARAASPELRAVINADGAVPHRRVIETLDELKAAGVAHVAFGALPAGAPE